MALMTYREANQVLWRGVRPAHNGTLVYDTFAIENNALSMYTVPAGQTLFLCNVIMSYLAIAAGRYAVYVNTAVPAFFTDIFEGVTLATSEGIPVARYYWPPLEVPAGYDIMTQSTAAGLNLQFNLHGWVE